MKKVLYAGFVSFLSLSFILLSCTQEKKNELQKFSELVSGLYDSTLMPFYHGVASGDPLSDGVIIWTRVTPEDSLSEITVAWQVAEDENFSKPVLTDSVTTSPSRDYTVKVDVRGLQPDRFYYYRFSALGKTSATGRTKTAPVGDRDSIRLAIVSCANWEFGYFNAYDRIAGKDVDAVLHLGDYIYEYGTGVYGNKKLDRKNLPAHEIVTLKDYRTRYSQYHLDKGLRHARMKHPFITIWDDHEVANNTYATGAQNHQPDKEGDFNARKQAARQAYYEWIPIRENAKHYRAFHYGNLADVIMLDERLEGRTRQLDSISDPTFGSEEHTMLGQEQLSWFENELRNSKSTWKVIGNQVIFSDLDQSIAFPDTPKNLDSWDGYPVEKKRIAKFIVDNRIEDLIILSGDTHGSWGFEVAVDAAKTYNKKNSQGALAVEFGVTSISSSNWNEYTTDDTVKTGESDLMKANPHLKYINQRDHGYLLLTLSPNDAKAEWYYIETLATPDDREHLGKKLQVKKGKPSLQ
ncbi:MAG: alkaline phosphatase D family protein [Bacteroidota bacterium]